MYPSANGTHDSVKERWLRRAITAGSRKLAEIGLEGPVKQKEFAIAKARSAPLQFRLVLMAARA